ncbi:hypothetical protein AB5J62_04310 [Amycolatopsis sp. cg5]|uniref:hypothetical protein n=1 Tax=Amycolatopsis sp. cg5 TaxID=3238802 RepID=UPI003526659C
MRKVLIGVLLACAAAVSVAGPATAAPDTVQSGNCKNDEKTQDGDGITVRVWFKSWNTVCKVDRVAVYQNSAPRYGHFHVFGPDDFSQNSPVRSWARSEEFNTYPWFTTWGGDLWCGRFYDGNNNPMTRAICVTV